MNIHEIAIRDSRDAGEIVVEKIDGKENPSDMFTKEHKDDAIYLKVRDMMACSLASMGGVRIYG